MIHQNDEGILPDAQKYSCRFNALARAREVILGEPWTVAEYNKAWEGARSVGIISGDLNHDGDYDDEGEDEILKDQELFYYLGLPLCIVPFGDLPTMKDQRGILRVAPTKAPFDPMKYWVLEKWIWRYGHFIQGDGTGKANPIWDPLRGGSLTRARGRIESLRVFRIERKGC